MPTINTNIPQICFSSMLPDVVNVTTDAESAAVTAVVTVDNVNVFETTIYGSNYRVNFYDIRSIIEAAIRHNNNIDGECEFEVTEGSSTANTNGFTVIISDRIIPGNSAILGSQFLTTLHAQRISRTGRQKISWYATQNETITYKIHATLRNNITQLTEVQTWTQQQSATVAKGSYSATVDVATIAEHFGSNYTLLAFTVERGANRKIDFFVTDEQPSSIFVFTNNFNAEEFAEVYGATVHKSSMESSEARIMYSMQKYDFDLDQSFELESSLVNTEEYEFLAQLLTSRYVAIKDGSVYREVLTDGEAEVSYNHATENRFKMSYKFARK